jgi:regulator of nucleoside diphosphate kinase
MRNLNDLIITNIDLARLQPVLDAHDTPAAESLDAELHRARVVEQRDVPADVVTMNSEVVYEDMATSARRRVKLVYPQDADPGQGHVSVLAPIGSALLGLRVNQSIDWPTPSGTKRIRVLELPYQPEAAGDFDR